MLILERHTLMIFKKVIFLILFCVCSIAYADEIFDVRKIHWEMNSEEVIKSEDRALSINRRTMGIYPGYLILSTTISYKEGLYSLLSYVLKDDHLVSVSYWFYPTKMNRKDYTKELYIDDFKQIQEDIEKQYGKPSKIIIDYQCIWNIDNTIAIHLIQKQSGSVSHGIIFYDANVWKSMGENSVLLNP